MFFSAMNVEWIRGVDNSGHFKRDTLSRPR